MGAAYSFALRAGAKPRDGLQHAFYCGRAATRTEILHALEQEERVAHCALGNVTDAGPRMAVPDLLAFIVARGGIVALYQGCAETGPRALGHRSILANPCDPHTLESINRQVKFREPIRPLAPMVTPEQAPRFFELSEGAADDGYNAYNYMVLTVRVRAEARTRIPAVVHRDGTARIQIVRSDHDPFSYEFLKAMGRRAGVEVAVNTSFNVGSPIVQTPEQALVALRKAHALTALLLISVEGDAFIAWDKSNASPKDGGTLLFRLIEVWGGCRPGVAARHRCSEIVDARMKRSMD
jgi:carbamoyltransferase